MVVSNKTTVEITNSFLFVIMLLNVEDEEKLFDKFRVKYFLAFILGAAVVGQIFYSIAGVTNMLPEISSNMAEIGTIEAAGDVLYTKYLLLKNSRSLI